MRATRSGVTGAQEASRVLQNLPRAVEARVLQGATGFKGLDRRGILGLFSGIWHNQPTGKALVPPGNRPRKNRRACRHGRDAFQGSEPGKYKDGQAVRGKGEIMPGLIEEAFFTLVSPEGPTFPVKAPEGQDYPYKTFQKITETGVTDDLDGAGVMERAIIQVDHWSENYDETKASEKAVKDILNGFRGVVNAAGENLNIVSCFRLSNLDLPEQKDSRIIHRVVADYEFIFKPA